MLTSPAINHLGNFPLALYIYFKGNFQEAWSHEVNSQAPNFSFPSWKNLKAGLHKHEELYSVFPSAV